MSEIRVECYAGHRADERPLRFVIRGREFLVHEIDGRWYSPEASYFRVRADDGNYYVLRHDETQNSWTLDGFRATGREDREGQMAVIKVDLRRHERILVPDATEIHVTDGLNGRLADGVATVIGPGGMFVRTKTPQAPGAVLALTLECPLISLELGCTVRHNTEKGMGVEFTDVTPENGQKLQSLLLQLRAPSLDSPDRVQ
jgi:hypothetical protein